MGTGMRHAAFWARPCDVAAAFGRRAIGTGRQGATVQDRPGRVAAAVAVFASLLMAGCADMQSIGLFNDSASTASAQQVAPADPIAAFAAQARRGDEATVVWGGQPVRVRLVDSYFAASGRECRVVAAPGGAAGNERRYCHQGEIWVEARPLLRAGTARP